MKELHQIREALLQLEWGAKDDDEDEGSYCPACYKCKTDGHDKDCWLSSVIAATKIKPGLSREQVQDIAARMRGEARALEFWATELESKLEEK